MPFYLCFSKIFSMFPAVRVFNFHRFLPNLRRRLSAATMSLNELADVDIDKSGVFKYILIQAKNSSGEKFIVRGYARCEYHADIFDVTERKAPKGVELKCVGGGRINHEPNKINVYGYSQGYGQADHKKSVEILRKKYPDYDISSSNDGY